MAAPQYRGPHPAMRAALIASFRQGQPCAECGRPLYARRLRDIHLAHDHVNGGYKGLAHGRCNVAEGNQRRAKQPASSGRRW